VRACTFEAMKGNAAAVAPLGGAMWKGGAETFINKGTNGRWKQVLTKAQVEAYEKAAEARLGKDCADWLAGGGDAREYV
jgi:aryl sulfotransferase